MNENWLVVNNEMKEDNKEDIGISEKCENCGTPLNEDGLCPDCEIDSGAGQEEDFDYGDNDDLGY